MRRLIWLCAAAGTLAVGAAGPAAAAGFYVQEQSVRAVGRAFSGEAADTGVASLWWNPAAIAGVPGRGELYFGAHAVKVQADVDNRGSTIRRPGQATAPISGAPTQFNPVDFGVVPNLAGAWRLNDQWVVGLAVNAPFNFTSRYDTISFVRYQALKSSLLNLDVQPTVAWRPTSWLDLGVGFDAQYTRATLTSALPNLSPLLPDASSSLKGDGWDYGWNAGLQAHQGPVTVGVSYRSQIKHHLDGRVVVAGLLGPAAAANADADGSATITTPWMLTVGGRYKATDKLTLNAQVQRIGWSQFDAIRVAYAGRFQVTPQNYRNTTTIAGGVDYDVTPSWTLRAGVQRDPTPTIDSERSARVPDSKRWIYAVGTSVRPKPNLSLDVSFAYIDFADGQLASDLPLFAGSALQTPMSIRADIRGHGGVIATGLRWNF
jgi:long-chain fatty acid transport protein